MFFQSQMLCSWTDIFRQQKIFRQPETEGEGSCFRAVSCMFHNSLPTRSVSAWLSASGQALCKVEGIARWWSTGRRYNRGDNSVKLARARCSLCCSVDHATANRLIDYLLNVSSESRMASIAGHRGLLAEVTCT